MGQSVRGIAPARSSEEKLQWRSLVTKQYTCYAPKIKECDGVPTRLLYETLRERHRTFKLVNVQLCLLKYMSIV
ncbi:hypothetical protein LC608_34355 [Nostoc sp. XA010]|uniref:hypothetical protein n=1 Tax=Nostoc sp. XA010 TaxID=2780407 RepID=UPI001E653E9C|nr:hypothetical protein [Nostoc sp. XA010]MCC5661934.1 hypothetical protein [Nostoc sp. XA010]